MTRFWNIPVGGHFSFPKAGHAIFLKTSDRHMLPLHAPGSSMAPSGGHRIAADTVVVAVAGGGA